MRSSASDDDEFLIFTQISIFLLQNDVIFLKSLFHFIFDDGGSFFSRIVVSKLGIKLMLFSPYCHCSFLQTNIWL